MSIALFHFQLPFMTLGDTTEHQRVLSNGAPPLPDLLTFDRFLHRTGLIERQLATFFSHPLFLDILRATCQADIEHTRLDTLKWMKHVGTPNSDDAGGSLDHEVLAVTDIPTVWASVGSSAGNVRHVSPFRPPFLTSGLPLDGFNAPYGIPLATDSSALALLFQPTSAESRLCYPSFTLSIPL